MKKYISTLLIIALLSPFLLPFSVEAAPLNDDLIPGDVMVSSNGLTYYPIGDGKGGYKYVEASELTNKLTNVTGNSFKKMGKALLTGFENGYGTIIYALKPESSYSQFDKECVALIDKSYNGSATVSDVNEIFTISDNQLTIKDSFQVNINNIVEQASDNMDSTMILYQTQSIDNIDKFILWDEYSYNGQWYDYTKSNVTNLITSNFSDEDYPLYFSHSTSSIGIVSLSNISGDYSCDGLVCSNNWSGFLERFTAFQNNGYLNNLNGQEITASFNVYASGRLFDFLYNDFKYLEGGSSVLTNPFSAYAYAYSEYRPTMIRNQSCIISLDGAPMIFFKDTESYLNLWNNKYVVPYDFQNSNIDYSDFFNNLDQDALDIADNLSDIYDVLNNAVVEGLQDAVDRLTTTNQWLKKIYNKVDDWKKEWNFRNILSTLTDIVGAVDDLIDIQNEVARLVNNTITSPIVDNIESMVEDVTLASTLKSRFPFCIPIALVGTVDYISSFEAKPITFSISSNALGVPINFNFDYEDVPGNQIATLIVRSFIFLMFAFGMYRLTLRIIDIGKD